jgi:replication factor C subunit 3/5
LSTLLETTNVVTCLTTIHTLKATRGLALADILTALGEELVRLDVPAQTRVLWLDGLAEVEARLAGGGGEVVQTGGLVGVVRGGCEVMGNK